MISFRRAFNPTPEEIELATQKYAEIHRENIKKKSCCTCTHYVTKPGCHPGFVTGADEACDTGRCPNKTCEDYALDVIRQTIFDSAMEYCFKQKLVKAELADR